MGLQLSGSGTIEIYEDLLGCFGEEFGIGMRWGRSLGHCSSVQVDVTDSSWPPILGKASGTMSITDCAENWGTYPGYS